jgi:hypothetical protein
VQAVETVDQQKAALERQGLKVVSAAYDPSRKYLSASNWFFLSLKVAGYGFVGGMAIYLPIMILILVASS